jgi:putative peptide zinc metalloprotease protein
VLYALAEEVDGRRDTAQIAEALSRRIRRGVDAEMVETLLDGQLRRLGLVAQRNGVTAEVPKLDPLLALRFRASVVPAGAVRAATGVLRPLFWPPVMVAVVAGLVALDTWLFGMHGISQAVRHVLYEPALVLVLLGGVVAATAFHELGHATAVRYGGAEPGVMGVGLYIVWPAFYTDITDSYRLGKWGRLRADVGGMYFNAIYALAAAGVFAVTRFEPLLLLVALQTFAILQQALPLLRLDGYYIVSDLTGVPDILARVRPLLASLVPWRPSDARVTELKPWVRAVVTAYVAVLVPVPALLFLLMLVHAPRVFATAWDSLALRWDRVGHQAGAARAADVLQMVVLVLPCLGMLYTTGRAGRGAWRWSDGSRMRRAPLLVGTATAIAFVGFLWWPRGDYRPIQPGERGTVAAGVKDLGAVPSGRAALTVRREIELGGAPTERQRARHDAPPLPGAPSARTRAETVSPGPWLRGLDAPPGYAAPQSSAPASTTFAPPPATAASPAPPSEPTATQPAQQPAETTTTDTTTTDTTPTQTTTTETTPTQTTTTETTPTDTTTTSTTPTQTTPTQTTTTPPG